MKEIIEEIHVEWDMESCPFPVMLVETVNENGNGWLIKINTNNNFKQ